MTLHSKSIAALAGAAAAAAVAWRLGGAAGVGVAGGYLLGAAVTLWGVERQRVAAATRPARLWQAFGAAFLAKLGALLAAALLLRFVPALAETCDWRAFLVAYGAACVLVLLCGMREVASSLRTSGRSAAGMCRAS